MIDDNTPTVIPRKRKLTTSLRIRLENARRLQGMNARSKTKRHDFRNSDDAAASSATAATDATDATEDTSEPPNPSPRIPKAKQNTLSRPARPPSKFAKRQRHKTWLPTHIFHAKRAHMTPAASPLWRFMLPISPTEKSYRPTHRASVTRGAVCWDTSYMSTIGLHGNESSIEKVLTTVSVGDWSNKGKKWRRGTRKWNGWLCAPEDGMAIAPVSVVWCVEHAKGESPQPSSVTKENKNERRRLFVRVHPSAFLQVWDHLLSLCKCQSPPVAVEDLRFEIGSVEITGPGATEALLSALKPVNSPIPDQTTETSSSSAEGTWASLLPHALPASLPVNALFAFDISDPRLRCPPRTIHFPSSTDPLAQESLAQLLSTWPLDKTQPPASIFSRAARLSAARHLPSQKAINRRKSLAPPGDYPAPKETDPRIPVMVLATRNSGASYGSYSVLLPWQCVLPVWSALIYYPLSTGVQPRFGGVDEERQVTFEAGKGWFPGDYPGTQAGWEWELQEREKREKAWRARPKGKRVEWKSLDLGDGKKGEVGIGWACDWAFLVQEPHDAETKDRDGDLVVRNQEEEGEEEVEERTRLDADIRGALNRRPNISHLTPSSASALLAAKSGLRGHQTPSTSKNATQEQQQQPPSSETAAATPSKPENSLATVRLTFLTRGTPSTCARIYRLPTSQPLLRDKWLRLLRQERSSRRKSGQQPVDQLDESTIDTSAAASLPVPPAEDLIGFVTSGNFNLSLGRGTGIGCILLDRVEAPPPHRESEGEKKGKRANTTKTTPEIPPAVPGDMATKVCIVRNAGESAGRLAFWELV